MAADATKQLLLKFRSDLRDLRSNFSEVEKVVTSFNKVLAKDRESNRRQIRDALQEALKGEHAKQAAIKTTAEQERLKIVQQKQEQEILKTTLLQRRQETAEIQKQLAQLRLRTQEEARANREAGKHGGGRGGESAGEASLLGSVTRALSGVTGGGLAGSVFAGAFLGGGAAAIMEGVAEAIGHIAESMKEFITASGPLAQVTEQFEKLTKGANIDGKKFFNELEEASHGLVDDMEILRVANGFLQSGLKVSKDDVIKLTQATVGLARAQGKDATQAMNALQRSFITGRFQLLGYVTGIQRNELQIRGMTGAMTQAQRSQRDFDHMLEVISKRYQQIGEPALTYTDRLQQLKIKTEQFFESIGKGAAQATGFQIFTQYLGQAIDHMKALESLGESVGEALGDAFGFVSSLVANTLVPAFSSLSVVIDQVVTGIKQLYHSFVDNAAAPTKSYWDDVISRLTTVAGIFKTLTQATVLFRAAFMKTAATVRYGAQTMAELAKHPFTRSSKTLAGAEHQKDKAEYNENMATIDAQTMSDLQDIEGQFNNQQSKTSKGVSTTRTADQNFAMQQRLRAAQIEEKIAQEHAKALFEIVKGELDKERAALEDKLKAGETSLQEYTEKVKELSMQEFHARQAQIEAEDAAQKKSLKIQLDSGKMTRDLYNKQLQALDEQSRLKRIEAVKTFDKEEQTADEKLTQDKIAARKVQLDGERKLEEENIADRKKLLENDFKDGEVLVQDYMAKRRQLIEEEKALELRSAQDKYDISDKGLRAQAQLYYDTLEAQHKADQQFTDLQEQELDIRLQNIEKHHAAQQGLAQSQLTTARTPGVGSAGAEQTALGNMINDNVAYYGELDRILYNLEISGKAYGDEWMRTKKTMQDVLNQTRQLESEMNKSRDFFGGVGTSGVLGQFSSLAKLPSLGGLQSLLSTLGGRTAAGPGSIFGDIFSSFGNMIHPTTSQYNPVSGQYENQQGGFSFKGLFDNFGKFSDALAKGTTTVTQFVETAANPQGGIMGAVTGAISGAGLGKDIGSMFSKFSKFAGPIGQAAGAAFGAVLSGIMGSKMQRAQDALRQLTNQFNQVTQAVKDGTISLADGITQLESIRQATYAQMNSSKKKSRSMFQSAIDSMNQQIQALQAQQAKLMSDLVTQVSILGAPLGMQDALTSLDQIIEKYKQFAGAARDANDLANANNYLAYSLKNFALTEGKELSDAEQNAIQDAIKLNDLYIQRNQILSDYAQTQRDIMTSGVQIYTRTTAQTKMEQLEQATYQRDLQLQQINQEIALTKYKVDSESKIFSLATTRIGLEAQLLQLQEAQTTLDMQRIASLQAIVTQMASMPMDQLMKMLSSGANTTFGATDAFSAFLKSMGLNAPSSTTPISNVLEQQYWYQLLLRSQMGSGYFGIGGG